DLEDAGGVLGDGRQVDAVGVLAGDRGRVGRGGVDVDPGDQVVDRELGGAVDGDGQRHGRRRVDDAGLRRAVGVVDVELVGRGGAVDDAHRRADHVDGVVGEGEALRHLVAGEAEVLLDGG